MSTSDSPHSRREQTDADAPSSPASSADTYYACRDCAFVTEKWGRMCAHMSETAHRYTRGRRGPALSADELSKRSGIALEIDPSIPPGEVHAKQDGKTVAKIVNVGPASSAELLSAAEGLSASSAARLVARLNHVMALNRHDATCAVPLELLRATRDALAVAHVLLAPHPPEGERR